MNTVTVAAFLAAGGIGVLVGVLAAQVLFALMQDDYSDIWDLDESEEP